MAQSFSDLARTLDACSLYVGRSRRVARTIRRAERDRPYPVACPVCGRTQDAVPGDRPTCWHGRRAVAMLPLLADAHAPFAFDDRD